ncbi:hypothetical protein Tco_0267746 [Tanacetum coccineum]
MESSTQNALIAQDRIRGYDWSYQAEEEEATNYALMAYTSSGSSFNSDSKVDSCSKTCVKAYDTLKEQYDNEQVKSKSLDVVSNVTPSDVNIVESKHESVEKNSFRPPIIEDWNSNNESEVEPIDKVKTVRPSTKKIKFVKTTRETVETPKQNKHYPRGNQRNWNNLMSQRLGSNFKMINKACFVCGSFEHLHYVCDQKVVRPVWNNTSRVNHKNFANKMTHPHPNRRFVPQAILTRTDKRNTVRPVTTADSKVINTVRPVNTAVSKSTLNCPRPMSNTFKRGRSHVTRPFNKYSPNNNSIFNKKVNTVRVNDTTARERAIVSENKGIGANAVKASACWVWKAKHSSASNTFKKYSYNDA